MPTPSRADSTRPAPVSVTVASRTDVGLVRENNEDALVLGELASGRRDFRSGRIGPCGILFGVCDGMGGAAAGEVASRLAAKTIVLHAAQAPQALDPEEFSAVLSAAITRAGDEIRANVAANPSRSGMGTTATVVAVRGGQLIVAHVGDSRAYLSRDGELRQLTRDQNWANELLARGQISPERAAFMENGKHIVQAVGTSEELEIAVERIGLHDGDKVLVCSDGLSDMVSDASLAEVLRRHDGLEAIADELLKRAHQGGGRDNISFVVCEFSGAELGSAPEAGEFALPVKVFPRSVLGAVLVLVFAGAGLAYWRTSVGHSVVEKGPSGPRTSLPAASSRPPRVAEQAPAFVPGSDVAPVEEVGPEAAEGRAPQRPERARTARKAQKVSVDERHDDVVQVRREIDPMAGNPF